MSFGQRKLWVDLAKQMSVPQLTCWHVAAIPVHPSAVVLKASTAEALCCGIKTGSRG